jgi:hypothetical protein
MCKFFGGDEGAEVYGEKSRTARKPHCCDGCGGTIEPGTLYTYYSGIYDGTPFHGHACTECVKALDAFVERHDGAPSYETLVDALAECIEEDGPTSWAVPFLEGMKARRTTAESKAVAP